MSVIYFMIVIRPRGLIFDRKIQALTRTASSKTHVLDLDWFPKDQIRQICWKALSTEIIYYSLLIVTCACCSVLH
jgi:hypothetical protein